MELVAGATLENLADESLVAVMAFLPAGSVVNTSAAALRFTATARADVLWLPHASRRWHFGIGPASREVLPPGARERASESALAEAARAPLQREAGAFAFYARRCSVDAEVALLSLQLDAIAGRTPAPGLDVGAVVRLVRLDTAKYNGTAAVVFKLGDERCEVTLHPSLKGLRIRVQNLELRGPGLTEEEAEGRVLALGDEAVDALVRFAKQLEDVVPAGSSLERTTKRLLAAVTEQWAVRQWEVLLADPGRADLLEEGGLVVSQWAEPGKADVAAVRNQLTELANAVVQRTTASSSVRHRVEAVNSVLFDEWGFSGNTEQYYDPRNSFLHCVLERKRGIPISLSIVWVAVARRVDVPCFLCADMPQHILVRVNMGSKDIREDIFVDAFDRCIMDYNGLLAFTARRFIAVNGFDAAFAVQRPATAVYARLLRNLISIYRGSLDGQVLSEVVEAHQRLSATCAQAMAIATDANRQEAEHLKDLREKVRERLAVMRSHHRMSRR
mmetsp:Transcript_83798/g.194958  ORF Transcript_83798/g.194958 Transcript_83798/m.194958 type:complete len:502 (-) Transcript_83798:102-1607(-)